MQLTIPIDAIPQQRPRVANGIVYDPPKCKKFKQDFSFLLKSLYRDNPLNGALNAQIDIFRNFKDPTQKRYGDADNLAKPILDAANLILWLDDSQIVDLRVRKLITKSNPFVNLSFNVFVDDKFVTQNSLLERVDFLENLSYCRFGTRPPRYDDHQARCLYS